jgi:two-component system, sensor histidine kinase LadS
MAGMLLSFAWLIFTLVMTVPTAPVYAAEPAPLVLTGPADVEALSPHLEYTTDPEWQMKAEDFVGPAAIEMRPLPGPRPDFGYTTAKTWLRLRVVNGTTDDWRFQFHVGYIQQIAIYRIGSDDAVRTLLDLNEDSPFSARPIAHPQIVAPFDLAPGEAATILVSYYGMGAARHAMSVETPDSLADNLRVSAAKGYAFYGMMLVMVALALVALVTLRQLIFAAYAGYLSSIFLYVAFADGAAFQFIWPSFPELNTMASVVIGTGVMVFGGLFAISFLQTARFHPIMHRVLLALIVLVLALDAILWTADPRLLNRLLVYVILVCVLTFLTAGIIAARKRFREVRFYVFAWAASLIPASLFTARFAFGIEPTFITLYDTVRLALVVDALMMGLAIFDRYNHLRRAAMEETLAHTARNLALSQRLAALEAQYQQVTATARRREEGVKDTVHDLRQPMQALRLSFRQMFNPDGNKGTDAGQVESALAYMERLVAERLADNPAASEATSVPVTGQHGTADLYGNVGDRGTIEPGVHAVLRGIADMFAAEATGKGLELRLVLAAPDGPVAAYPLMRVVANLVSNAIKYTRQGRIVIALRRQGAGRRIEVHDTGPGLNGAAFEQALLRNQRLDRDRAVAEGSGLGLSVVKQIAEANDWRISSCADRQTGASIRIELPGLGTGLPAGGQLDASEVVAPN